jgi:hypothetical protein
MIAFVGKVEGQFNSDSWSVSEAEAAKIAEVLVNQLLGPEAAEFEANTRGVRRR